MAFVLAKWILFLIFCDHISSNFKKPMQRLTKYKQKNDITKRNLHSNEKNCAFYVIKHYIFLEIPLKVGEKDSKRIQVKKESMLISN